MFIVTIEEVREETKKSIIGTKKVVLVDQTIYHQKIDSLDLGAVIAAINEKGSSKPGIDLIHT